MSAGVPTDGPDGRRAGRPNTIRAGRGAERDPRAMGARACLVDEGRPCGSPDPSISCRIDEDRIRESADFQLKQGGGARPPRTLVARVSLSGSDGRRPARIPPKRSGEIPGRTPARYGHTAGVLFRKVSCTGKSRRPSDDRRLSCFSPISGLLTQYYTFSLLGRGLCSRPATNQVRELTHPTCHTPTVPSDHPPCAQISTTPAARSAAVPTADPRFPPVGC